VFRIPLMYTLLGSMYIFWKPLDETRPSLNDTVYVTLSQVRNRRGMPYCRRRRGSILAHDDRVGRSVISHVAAYVNDKSPSKGVK
jgi:hypothetical protein